MSDFKFKMHKNQRSPDPLAGWGTTSKGREGRGREGKESKWNPLRTAHQRYRQTTDTLQTDGRCHKSNVKTTV